MNAEGKHLLEPVYRPSFGRPLETLLEILKTCAKVSDAPLAVSLTGSGRQAVREALGLSSECLVTEIYAHAYSAWNVFSGVRSIIDIGGQDSKVIRLNPLEQAGFSIADFVMNELCAAGTGAFLEMHSRELGFASIEEFAGAAVSSKHPAKIAGRCSILAQSDIVHLRQAGIDLADIAAGLCRAIVRNVLAMSSGKKLLTPIFFQGGVASNRGVVEALRAELNLGPKEVIVPVHHRTMGAIGAALSAARESFSQSPTTLANLAQTLEQFLKLKTKTTASDFRLEALKRTSVESSKSADIFVSKPKARLGRDVILGFDIGSLSSKIAVLDSGGDCLWTYYKLHEGKPIEALYAGLSELKVVLAEFNVKAVGVTGSGRDFTELRVGADINIDEITAQGAGAKLLDPGVEAIFEIGGQDSKFISFRQGRVVDFEMNRICAAGTGAFIQEASKILGVSSAQAMDELAFSSERPVFISNRCCVFAKSDMVSLLNSGVSPADVAAGVFYAVAKNYLNLVVGVKLTAKKILFLGGVAKNSAAILAALKNLRPDIDIVVPQNCQVSGALGAAAMTLEHSKAGDVQKSKFRGFESSQMNFPVSGFNCNGCSNCCSVQKWQADNEESFTGSICGRYEGKSSAEKIGRNFVDDYLKLLRSYEAKTADDFKKDQAGQKEVIGIPRALLYYEQGPLWIVYLRRLGFSVVVSDAGRDAVKSGILLSPVHTVCLPIKVLLGQVADLKAKGIKKIFYPTVVEMQRFAGASRSDNCMLIQASADTYLKPVFPELEFISPVFNYQGRRPLWRKALVELGVTLGVGQAASIEAVVLAEAAQKDFESKKEVLGRGFLQAAKAGRPCVVLLSREYSCAPELDMSISRYFAKFGAAVAPLAIFPEVEQAVLGQEHFDLVFKSSQKTVLGIQYLLSQGQNIFPVVLNQFLCRQDACVIPFTASLIGQRPFLHITLDENAGNIGVKTRCAAFWEVIVQRCKALVQEEKKLQPFFSFVPDPHLKKFSGVVWMNRFLRFYSAAYLSVGIKVKFFPAGGPDVIDRGRKYFPDGEPCLPFIREAGQLEKLLTNSEFSPSRDMIHVAGTRHCASTTLPALYQRVFNQLGNPKVKIVSPREGLDATEGVETFGWRYVQGLVRGMAAEQYLKKMLMSIRPYEINQGETDKVFSESLEGLYSCFEYRGGRGYFETLKDISRRLAAVKTAGRGQRPKVLVTGEYVVRNDASLNGDIHRRIEFYGGEAVMTPLFSDFTEFLGTQRTASLWKLGYYRKAVREFFLLGFMMADIRRIKKIFSVYIPEQIEPDPAQTIKEFSNLLDQNLDSVMLLEFYQCFWNVRGGQLAGIVNVHPFGCSISTAVEPLLYTAYGQKLPILSLSFDGQANVHTDNRLAAFMECVKHFSKYTQKAT